MRQPPSPSQVGDPTDLQTQHAADQLDYPVWVQIVDLCQILREETFFRTIGEQIGQVITIDSSEAYRAKLFGPRIRLLVRDLNNLPQVAVLPLLDGEGTIEYKLEYSGLPNQCGRCRSRDHLVRNCPKRDSKMKRRTHPRPARTQPQHVPTERRHTAPATPTKEQVPTETLTVELPMQHTPPPAQQDAEPADKMEPAVELNEINFPQLQSPTPRTPHTAKPPAQEPEFIWRAKITEGQPPGEKGKGKSKTLSFEFTPLTRQGYRSGRLADDFWMALDTPDTPQTCHKKLRVIPFITKNEAHVEYLIDKVPSPQLKITEVHIAEVLAGIPWTPQRAQQHVVNEVAQALQKVLIFNSHLTSPFQKWAQGQWFANSSINLEGEHLCTLYVCVAVPESKIKIRKGRTLGWTRIPAHITDRLANTAAGQIHNLPGIVPSW